MATPTGIGDAFQAPGTPGTVGAGGFNYAGAAAGGIAVGLAAYGAYQFYESTSRQAGGAGATSQGAASGALGGALAGAQIGALGGPYGLVIGALVGLVAGGSLGGLAGSESEGRGNKQRHRAQRLKQARRLTESIANILDRPDAINGQGDQGIGFVVRQPVDASGVPLGGLLAGLGLVLGHPIGEWLTSREVVPQGYNYERINNLSEFILSMGGAFAVGKILDAALRQLQGIEDRTLALEQRTQVSYTETLAGKITRQTLIPVSGLDEYSGQLRGAGSPKITYSRGAAQLRGSAKLRGDEDPRGYTDEDWAYILAQIRRYVGQSDAQAVTATDWLQVVSAFA